MLTFPAIFRRSTNSRKRAAKHVVILEQRRGYTREGHGFYAAQTHSTHEWDSKTKRFVRVRNKPKYVTVVTVVDDDLHCVVSCSCPDFMYRWEVALESKGAAEIEYSNGNLPVIRNPDMAPRVCKHLVRVYNTIGSRMESFKPIKPRAERTRKPKRRSRRRQ